MDKIIDFIKQVISSGERGGLFFIVIGIIVGAFNFYELIAGTETISKKELAKIDLNYLCKSFGILISIFGLLVFLRPFLFANRTIAGIVEISYLVFMVLFFRVIKRDRIYNKNGSVRNNKEETDK